MKRISVISMIVVLMAVVVLAGCGSNNQTGNGGNNGSPSDGASDGGTKTIKLLNYKVEIADQLADMVAQYEQEASGVRILLETVGGDADQAAVLRAKFNSGDAPDIFVNGGYKELDLWLEHLEDLSDQPWVDHLLDVAKEPMMKDGRIYGQPLNLEGYGFIYNKDLFAQAGITELPTTIDELGQAAVKLEEAGITPFVNGYRIWWVLGNHLINVAFAQQSDPNAFVSGLDAGTEQFVGNAVFEQWIDLLDLTLHYGGSNPLQVDYNTQLADFAAGKGALTQQGNWMQVGLTTANPDLNVGFLPMPINNEAGKMDKLLIGVPYSWVVHKNSAVKDEAKAFLNWMVSSETGQRYITDEFKHIPAFDHIQADEEVLGQLAGEIIRYSSEGKGLTWNWFKFPSGEAASHKFSDAMQAYIGKQISREEMLQQFQAAWDDLSR